MVPMRSFIDFLIIMASINSTSFRVTGLHSHSVQCFGDSLTAGLKSNGMHPCAWRLAANLKRIGMTVPVREKGFSGWTADALLKTANETNGFQTILTKQPCELAVLLAGTNDLGHPPKRHDLPRGEEIAQNVWGLHELAHARSIHTIALAVPPSHYQAAVPAAATLRAKVNNILRAKCEAEATTRGLCTYVPFPFDWSKDSPLWEPDGLHLTAEGYDALGDSLAPLVRKILAKSEY